MRALDANVVLRYLLRDVAGQWERAAGLIQSGEPLGMTAVALAEVAWTLAGPQHRLDRLVVPGELIRFLDRENILAVGFDKEVARVALLTCARTTGAADFGDALITACARSFGIEEIYSFDQRFVRAGLTPIAPA